MTKLRKSKLDVVEPSYVLKGNEYFVIHHSRKDREERNLYHKVVDAMRADRFVKRKKFKTFAEAREYAKKANQKYGAKFGVSVTQELNLDRLFSKMPF